MKYILSITLSALLFVAMPSFANSKSVEHALSFSGIEHVELKHSVGNVRIVHAENASQAQLTGTIKGNSNGWFRRSEDISNADFEITTDGDTLRITFDQDNAAADLVLTIPPVASLSIKLGVGDLQAALTSDNTRIKLGVGNAELTAQLADVGNVTLATGVGDTHVSGTANQTTSRAIVTSDTQAMGMGSSLVEVKVGVGNANLKLMQ
ncbi:hypothetical protein CWE15_08825 [Aliidiomarina taiwanensis]|uniref:Adhesin domain-containing protein n=1 Tax=Aliidiomarina taiwanensis TaxID=946228 RepID=A0A432X1C8_9GAMM|nr:hypothetical protein [Aliidiomarina taiwanensis]RUO39847.1 hypothetical protein CWE15_08825 [Aliidiomarina taiwanensis]